MDAPRHTTSSSAPSLIAAVLAPLTSMLMAMRLRLTVAEWSFAWPWPSVWPLIDPVLMVLVPLTLLMAALAWRRQMDRPGRVALTVCLAWPALPLALAWTILPATGSPSILVPAAALLVVPVGWWLQRSAPRRPPQPGRPRPLWLWLHAAVVAGLVIMALIAGGFSDLRALGLSLVLYPVYALVQLFLILAVLWPRLQLLAGNRTGPAAGTVAVIFGLIHWPNPTLIVITAAGMAFWAVAYARGRGLLPLALSMGLLASLAAQGLPDDWTDHMRAGPRFVRQRAVPKLARIADDRTSHLPEGKERTLGFLAEAYPDIVGREPDPAELECWWRSLAPCRRGVMAWRFYISDEYQRRFGEPAGERPLPVNVHWTALPPPWPERIGAFTRPLPDGSDASWSGFVERCYRSILQRSAANEEIASWRQELSGRQKRRLVRVLLEQRRHLAAAPLDTLDCATIRLHH